MTSVGVLAHEQDTQARVWGASCAACHGTQGTSLGGIPSLAGVDKTQLLQKLQAFKQGTLPATVMHQHTKGYTDAELARLADFFSRQPR
ncbi:MAG: c-type cytochrome [Pseudomonadota bacterium]